MAEKTRLTAGADERTPSRSEYFSWINNTNEGSTEAQSLVNLAFFRYMKETYGMQLDIYAWDAGNLDGACGSYERPDGEKLSKQYPNGYSPVVEAAAASEIRMGVWGGPDGYGATPEEAEARRDLLVSLCRDYHWALFKFDTVCDSLRAPMREEFAKTMRECRMHSPDLILLNHRGDFGEADVYATTSLWDGQETYVDVHAYNPVTAPHNRAYTFFRGHTPNLNRLTEDHGVSLSASLDYFEDDLVYQAFNRSLILAPEIYGNPWLLRDDELPLLARIFNFHRRHREILVDGMLPAGDLGNNPAVRGDGRRRFFSAGNASWKPLLISLKLDKTLGLERCGRVCVTRRFPTEKYIGTFSYGESAKIEIPAFRVVLIELCDAAIADPQLTGCEYAVLHETDGMPDRVNLLSASGPVCMLGPADGSMREIARPAPFDTTLLPPLKLGSLAGGAIPADAEALCETAYFGADNDSLEKRSLRRSGQSRIPEVRAAREAFFRQPSYVLRGLDGDIPFDGDPETVYDTKSRTYIAFSRGCRIEGGGLRADFGGMMDADRVEIEYFEADGSYGGHFDPQTVQDNAEISANLRDWMGAPLLGVTVLRDQELNYFAFYRDELCRATGLRKLISYRVAPFRYLRIPEPVDHIFSVRVFRGEEELLPPAPRLNNLFPPYGRKKPKAVSLGEFVLPKLPLHPYLAVAIEGKTGNENVVCCAEIAGVRRAFPSRAPAYYANPYEYPVHPVEGNYTFFLPLSPDSEGKTVKIYALFAENAVPADVYLCDGNGPREGMILDLGRANGEKQHG